MWGKSGSEAGAVLMTTAVVLVVLLGLAALAIDLSLALNERRTGQNAADHAALSASWAKCNGNDPVAAANSSVVRNGYTTAELTLTNTGGNEYDAHIDTSIDTFFASLMGSDAMAVSARAMANCTPGGGSAGAVFALGDTCRSVYGKRQIDLSGSSQNIYGGIHSNDDIHVGGSNNDLGGGNGNPPTDPVTYVSVFDEGGSGNSVDPLYPQQVAPRTAPVSFGLADYDTGGAAAQTAAAAGQYYRVDGDIDGTFIQSNGDGLYYATGDITLDVTVDLDVTLVAEGVIEVSASNSILDPYIDNLLLYGANPYTGIERCDKFVVSIGGSSSAWSGIIYGPHGLVELNGSSTTTFTGSIISYAVRFNGSDLTVIFDPSLFPGDPDLRLSE
jgi:hypothetical protein